MRNAFELGKEVSAPSGPWLNQVKQGEQTKFRIANQLDKQNPSLVRGFSNRFWFSTVDPRCRPVGPAIVAAIEQAILDGTLRPGEMLPTQRLTADLMGLHVNTINRAMREAAKRGLVQATSRQGTVVVGTKNKN